MWSLPRFRKRGGRRKGLLTDWPLQEEGLNLELLPSPPRELSQIVNLIGGSAVTSAERVTLLELLLLLQRKLHRYIYSNFNVHTCVSLHIHLELRKPLPGSTFCPH